MASRPLGSRSDLPLLDLPSIQESEETSPVSGPQSQPNSSGSGRSLRGRVRSQPSSGRRGRTNPAPPSSRAPQEKWGRARSLVTAELGRRKQTFATGSRERIVIRPESPRARTKEAAAASVARTILTPRRGRKSPPESPREVPPAVIAIDYKHASEPLVQEATRLHSQFVRNENLIEILGPLQALIEKIKEKQTQDELDHIEYLQIRMGIRLQAKDSFASDRKGKDAPLDKESHDFLFKYALSLGFQAVFLSLLDPNSRMDVNFYDHHFSKDRFPTDRLAKLFL